MLVNLNDVCIPAIKKKYAVGLFNTVNLEMAKGVIAAAEEAKSPIIIGTAEVLMPYASLEELSYFLIPMAKKASVPIVVHYDHGLTFDKCMEALKLGFSSVMYDCSTDPYEENVKKVAELTKIAHNFGATVEGELGHVGDNIDSLEGSSVMSDPSAFYTDPKQAKDYVDRTNIDALAVAVGTAHGAYTSEPKLDFERITEISNDVSIPLVLHGGSGLADADFRKATESGIQKINIFTDINTAMADGAKQALYVGKVYGTDLILPEIDFIKQATLTKIKTFGSSNKG